MVWYNRIQTFEKLVREDDRIFVLLRSDKNYKETIGAKIRSAVQHSMENRKAVNLYRYIYIAYISKI